MPLQNSENLEDQDRAVELMDALAIGASSTKLASYFSDCAEHARKHRGVVASFGRFPHKNAAVGRDTSEAELVFLEDGAGWAQVLDHHTIVFIYTSYDIYSYRSRRLTRLISLGYNSKIWT